MRASHSRKARSGPPASSRTSRYPWLPARHQSFLACRGTWRALLICGRRDRVRSGRALASPSVALYTAAYRGSMINDHPPPTTSIGRYQIFARAFVFDGDPCENRHEAIPSGNLCSSATGDGCSPCSKRRQCISSWFKDREVLMSSNSVNEQTIFQPQRPSKAEVRSQSSRR